MNNAKWMRGKSLNKINWSASDSSSGCLFITYGLAVFIYRTKGTLSPRAIWNDRTGRWEKAI